MPSPTTILFDELDCTADYYVVWWRKPRLSEYTIRRLSSLDDCLGIILGSSKGRIYDPSLV